MSSNLILVTGVSGFLGSHVVDKLVAEGYRVRGTARIPKVASIQEAFDATYGAGRVEVVGIDDLLVGDFSSALKGVHSIIHVASPMAGRTDPESNIKDAVEGTLNVVRQGYKAGIRLFSVASSMVACIGADEPIRRLTEDDWNNDTKEQALDGTRNPVYVYFVSKALAEKALRAFGEENPDSIIVTLNPPFFVGPYAPTQKFAPGDITALGTNLVLHNILRPRSTAVTPGYGFVDVRDVASGLVAALKQTKSSRNLLSSRQFDFTEAIDYLAKVRPELKDRLPQLVGANTVAPIDPSNAVKRLGITVTEWEKTVVDTVDSLVQIEKDWAAAGVDVEAVFEQSRYRL